MSTSANDLMAAAVTPFEVERSNGQKLPVFQKDLLAGEILDFIQIGEDEGDKRSEALLRLVARAICDKDGVATFSEKDLDRLREMPIGVFQQLSEAVMENAGILPDKGDEEGN